MNNETSHFLLQIISFKKYFYASLGNNFFTCFVEAPLVVEAMGNCPVCPPINPALGKCSSHLHFIYLPKSSNTVHKGKTSLDLNGARDDGVLGCSGISWTTCKQSAPRSRQTTPSTPHQSIFTGWMLFLTTNQQCQRTESCTIL